MPFDDSHCDCRTGHARSTYTSKRRKSRHFLRRLFRQVQSVGSLRDRVMDENQMWCVGRRQIPDWRQNSILSCAALRIARGGSCARVPEAIPVPESLNGFVRDRGRIRRTQYWTRRFVEPTRSNGAHGTGGLIDHIPLFLCESAGCGCENKKQCAFHGGDSPFWTQRTHCRRRTCLTDPSGAMFSSATK